jgi:hypothetical protein
MKTSNISFVLFISFICAILFVHQDNKENMHLFQTASYSGVLTHVESYHGYNGGEIFEGTIVVDGKQVVKKVSLEQFVQFIQNNKKPTPITVALSAADFGANVSAITLNYFPIIMSLVVGLFSSFFIFIIDFATRKGYVEHWDIA